MNMNNQNQLNKSQQVSSNQPPFHSVKTKKQAPKLPLLVGVAVLLIVVGVVGFFTLGKDQGDLSDKTLDTQVQDNTQRISTEGMSESDVEALLNATSEVADETAQADQQDLPVVEIVPVDNKANLSLSSSQEVYQVGDQVEIIVQLNTGTVPDGVQYVISYDPTFLSEVRVEAINSFGSFLANKVDLEKNEIKGMLIREPQEEVDVAGPHDLAKIYAVASQPGNVQLQFVLPERTMVAAAGGQNILNITNDLSFLVN